MAFWLLPFYRKLTLHEFKSRLFPKTLIFPPVIWSVASHAGVFRGARISSVPTNACSTENNIPFPSLANHIVPSKFWKVDFDRRVTRYQSICMKHWDSFMTSNKCYTQSDKSEIQSDFRIIRALHNLSDSLPEHPVFSAVVSPAEKNRRRERSDDRKYVCGSRANLAKERKEGNR